MKIKLNDNQKKFLIENEYVTTKTVDAVSYKSLYTYFMVEFDWVLDTNLNWYNMNDLILESKDKQYGINYDLAVNFQNNDYDILINVMNRLLTLCDNVNGDINKGDYSKFIIYQNELQDIYYSFATWMAEGEL
jgi:hypothetical protein